jgi:hypothetical protein
LILGTGGRGLLAAVCLLAVAPAAAGAHGEASPLIRSVVESIEPRTEGVSFETVRGPVAQVAVRNRTRETLEIVSMDGDPFLRIGPRGVEGNVATPAWYESGNPDGQGRPDLRTGRRPVWKLVSRRPEWAYYEHRLHPRQVAVPPKALAERRPTKLGSFTVPFRIGGRPGTVRGRLDFRPVLGSVQPRVRSGATPLPGVSVTALPGLLPGLLLQNASSRTVTVLGDDGEPFARVGRRGVELNQRSPITVENMRQQGELSKVAVDSRAPPVWRRVKSQASLTWIEPRARYSPEQPPDAVVQSPSPTRLRAWEIPLVVGDQRVAVRGTTDWVPVDAAGRPRQPEAAKGGSPSGLLLGALGGATLLALGGALALRARRASAG